MYVYMCMYLLVVLFRGQRRGTLSTGSTIPDSGFGTRDEGRNPPPRPVERRIFKTPMHSKEFLCFFRGGRTGNRRFWAASRPNPAPGSLGKGQGRGPARFAPVFSPVDQS